MALPVCAGGPRVADQRQPGAFLRVDVRFAHEQAYARIGGDILGVLGEPAYQNDRPCGVVGHAGNHGAERIAREFFGQRREHAMPKPAQIAPGVVSLAHVASLSATVASRRPSAMHSLFSSSLTARSLAAPATWLAPYGVPPVVVESSSGSV